MTTYVTAFSRLLTAYSYVIGTIIQKLFSRSRISYANHCGEPIGHGYGSHCGSDLPESTRTNHCGQPIAGGYRGHC